MQGHVAEFNWSACDECKHADNENGGCLLMDDEELGSLSNFRVEFEYIICRHFEKEE